MGSSGPVSRYSSRDRLRAVARVDAARAEEHQPLHAGAWRGADQVRLDHQVLVEEVGAQRVVGLDAADLGGGDEDVVGPLARHEGAHRAPGRAGRARRACAAGGARSRRARSRRTSAEPTMPRWPATKMRASLSIAQLAPVVVFEADDVVLAEVRARLHLDDLERHLARVGEAMRLAERDVGALVLAQHRHRRRRW